MGLVERWWNGQFGKMARVDIWVWKDGDTWHVRGRRRGEGGPEVAYQWTGFHAELAARRMSQALRDKAPGNQQWRDIADAVRKVDDKYKWKGPSDESPLPGQHR